jgi:hypothetical protein
MMAAPLAAAAALAVSTGPAAITTGLGRTFEVRSTIVNRAGTPTPPLIAHLNVLSLGPGLYVDPEDWSSHRTRYLRPIPAHSSVVLRWPMTAVNPGRVGVYVALIPRTGRLSATTGSVARVRVGNRQTLNAGNVLPLALGLPTLVGLVGLGVVRRRSARP